MSASLKNKYKNTSETIGVAWYRPEQWALLRQVSTNREKLSETWSEWEATASARLTELRARGLEIRKVDVDVRELQAWCESRRRPIDGSARSEYVADHLRRHASTS
jgi:hypothetical protein